MTGAALVRHRCAKKDYVGEPGQARDEALGSAARNVLGNLETHCKVESSADRQDGAPLQIGRAEVLARNQQTFWIDVPPVKTEGVSYSELSSYGKPGADAATDVYNAGRPVFP